MDKKIKIAIVVYNLKSGGLERVVSNQTFMFSNLGFEVDLFVLENTINYPFKANLKVYDIKSTDNWLAKFFKYNKLRNDIKNGRYDYVLDHRYRLNDFMETIWLQFIYRKRDLIYFVHNSTIQNYISPKLALAKNIFFISVSKGIERIIKQRFPNTQIQTIYNNVEIEHKLISFSEINDAYILAVGRMTKTNVKQFDVLIDCYSKSILPLKKVKLLVLGSGDLLPILQQQVLDLNLQDLVVFKGVETHLFSYYKNAEFLVLSSKHEGLGMVLIESLVSGTPVISYDCDFGPNEIIKDRVNGLLVENQNKEKLIQAMNLFIENQDLYQFCRQNAKKSVEKFSQNQIAKQWLSFFNDKR